MLFRTALPLLRTFRTGTAQNERALFADRRRRARGFAGGRGPPEIRQHVLERGQYAPLFRGRRRRLGRRRRVNGRNRARLYLHGVERIGLHRSRRDRGDLERGNLERGGLERSRLHRSRRDRGGLEPAEAQARLAARAAAQRLRRAAARQHSVQPAKRRPAVAVRLSRRVPAYRLCVATPRPVRNDWRRHWRAQPGPAPRPIPRLRRRAACFRSWSQQSYPPCWRRPSLACGPLWRISSRIARWKRRHPAGARGVARPCRRKWPEPARRANWPARPWTRYSRAARSERRRAWATGSARGKNY